MQIWMPFTPSVWLKPYRGYSKNINNLFNPTDTKEFISSTNPTKPSSFVSATEPPKLGDSQEYTAEFPLDSLDYASIEYQDKEQLI